MRRMGHRRKEEEEKERDREEKKVEGKYKKQVAPRQQSLLFVLLSKK